ncbi:hypothetical protein M7I_0106 [Glarea lozoyensis 74030]|uniref:Uncharacterized protein n=1 Tax=Glarea lozoyensis (strain ATCC 74030 / MF5533) TaxID=1104152 RepID=H0ECG8_GLAL7|nr:hypothetical protein M7I_0106 [Glarea lozoyensis 74030]
MGIKSMDGASPGTKAMQDFFLRALFSFQLRRGGCGA